MVKKEMKTNGLETKPGTYILVLKCNSVSTKKIGRLGKLHLSQGYYLYVGSAHGPGGLYSRVKRHLKISHKKKHWHIDYIRSKMKVIEIWFSYKKEKLEHDWAMELNRLPFSTIPLMGFGSSDCKCQSHLFYFKQKRLFKNVRNHIQAEILLLP